MSAIEQQFVELIKVFLTKITWFNIKEVKIYVNVDTGALGYDNFNAFPGQPIRIINEANAPIDISPADVKAFGITDIIGVPAGGGSVTIALADDAPVDAAVTLNTKRQGDLGLGDGGGPIVGIKPPPGGGETG